MNSVWLTQDRYRGNIESPASLHRYLYNYNNLNNYLDVYGFSGEESYFKETLISGCDSANMSCINKSPDNYLEIINEHKEKNQNACEEKPEFISVKNWTAKEALDYYKAGTGIPVRMSFDEIDTSSVELTDFSQIRKAIKSGKQSIEIDDRLVFKTSGDQGLFLGNITLRLQGTLTKDGDDYIFKGTLKSYDDVYDFNASTHRGFIGEALTWFGREKINGTAFDIQIRGAKDINVKLEKSWKWIFY